MTLNRRQMLGVLTAGLGSGAGACRHSESSIRLSSGEVDWHAVRDLFPLAKDWTHLASFLLVSHPKPDFSGVERRSGPSFVRRYPLSIRMRPNHGLHGWIGRHCPPHRRRLCLPAVLSHSNICSEFQLRSSFTSRSDGIESQRVSGNSIRRSGRMRVGLPA